METARTGRRSWTARSSRAARPRRLRQREPREPGLPEERRARAQRPHAGRDSLSGTCTARSSQNASMRVLRILRKVPTWPPTAGGRAKAPKVEEATGSNARVQQEATEGQRKPTKANEKQPKATKSNRKQPKATKSNENRRSDQCDGARSPGGPRQRKNVFLREERFQNWLKIEPFFVGLFTFLTKNTHF